MYYTFILIHSAQTLYRHLWWLPSATCASGLFPSTTGAYSNWHCGGSGGGGGIYVVVVGACGNAGYICKCGGRHLVQKYIYIPPGQVILGQVQHYPLEGTKSATTT